MKKIEKFKSKLNLKRTFGLNSLKIDGLEIIPSVINELNIKLCVYDTKIEELIKLDNIIKTNLKEFEGLYKIMYILNFDESISEIEKCSYVIKKMLIEKQVMKNFLFSYELMINKDILYIYLDSSESIDRIKETMIPTEIYKEINKVFKDKKIEIKFALNNSITVQEKKEPKKEVELKEFVIIDLEVGKFIELEAEVFEIVVKDIKTRTGLEKKFVTFYITDYKKSLICKKFYSANDNIDISIGDIVKIKGTYKKDEIYTKEYYVDLRTITKVGEANHDIVDNEEIKRVELNLKTSMSEMFSNINPKKIPGILKKIGYNAFAVADLGVVHAYPFLFNAAPDGMKVIFGLDAYVVDDNAKLVTNPKNVVIEEETYVVFDIETTGLDPYNDKIIEIGAVKLKNFEAIDRFSVFINPEIPIPEFITNLTSITNEDVKNAEKIDIILPEFLKFIDDATLVAQNAKFDVGFITEKATQMGIKTNFSYIDTIWWAKLTLPNQKRFNLDALCKTLGFVNEHHHRAINDAEVTAKIFKELAQKVSVMNVNTLEDVNNNLQLDIRIAPTQLTTILVKNQAGLKTMYELVSKSSIDYFGSSKPRIPKTLLEKNRENFLISSSPSTTFNNSGELVSMYLRGLDKEEIEEAAKFYDYFQIMPDSCYEKEIMLKEINSSDYIKEMNKYFCDLAKKQNKLVVAVGNTMYMTKNESKAKSVLQIASGDFKSYMYDSNAHFRTTREMLDELNYLGEELSYDIVVKNTNIISDMIEVIRPIPKGFYPPIIEGANDMVKELTYNKAKELYGDNIPELIKQRLEKELNSIIGNGFAVLYLIAQKLVKKSVDSGYLVGSRGSVGSSLVAYLMGITEVNGLAPHYRCPNPECKNVEIFDKEISGVDLEAKDCIKCGTTYVRDGHAIPFEVFMGFNGDKVPDIDLNFSGEFQAEIHRYTEELFGKENVFRAGTIATTASNNAIGYVKKYFEESMKEELRNESIKNFGEYQNNEIQDHFRKQLIRDEFSKNSAEILRLSKLIEGTRKTTGQHPGGMVVVPSNMSVYDFTPIQKPANDLKSDSTITHFEYHVMDEQLVKLDILGHDDPTTLKMLEDLTGISPYSLPLNDEKVLSLFTSTKALNVDEKDINTNLGTNGIPEFGTNFVKEMLRDTKPTTFTELVRISGLSHGTDVWLNNAKDYVNSNIASLSEIITVRDDIMNYLILQGMEKGLAFKIMEFVRKGRPSKDKEQWNKFKEEMKKVGTKDWYIDSCEKIKYMFPKGHAVAYVMMAIRIAYFKVYYPLEFYTAYLNRKVSMFTLSKMFLEVSELKQKLAELNSITNKSVNDKKEITLLEILIEMHYRGIELLPVDLYKSEAKNFVINDGKIRIPFIGVDQLGEVVAKNIVACRENSKFTSQEDLMKRAGINNSVMKTLKSSGVLDGLSLTDQQKLF